ncbi:unnamed protein product [Cyprideis torosa]|uniref:Cyclin-dependent kinase inhibitor domain-containing protein n=1 Tax=Cyprideis torosa TaxID=163714 RepID=A0A7R8WKF1_9CRUS|nr:unnamed protein product [Cyprideis torosa]CAG0896894.1 unnamed protein product [Cyprideis torosa]
MKRPMADPGDVPQGFLTTVTVGELRRILFPRASKSPRRSLFEADTNASSMSTMEFLEEELRREREEQRKKWDFDFESMIPMQGGRFQWVKEAVPLPPGQDLVSFDEPALSDLIRSEDNYDENLDPRYLPPAVDSMPSTPPPLPIPPQAPESSGSSSTSTSSLRQSLLTEHMSVRKRPSVSAASDSSELPREKRAPSNSD